MNKTQGKSARQEKTDQRTIILTENNQLDGNSKYFPMNDYFKCK